MCRNTSSVNGSATPLDTRFTYVVLPRPHLFLNRTMLDEYTLPNHGGAQVGAATDDYGVATTLIEQIHCK